MKKTAQALSICGIILLSGIPLSTLITLGYEDAAITISFPMIQVSAAGWKTSISGFRSYSLHQAFSGSITNLDTHEMFLTIQQAIDDPDTLNGHTLSVGGGTYYEHIVVHKSVHIIAESPTTTIIDGAENGYGVTITANHVTLENLLVKNSTIGVFLQTITDVLLINCEISDCTLDGIRCTGSTNITISNCTVHHNTNHGIFMTSSSDCRFINVRSYNNSQYGIGMYYSNNNIIDNCRFYNDYYGVSLQNTSYCLITDCKSYNNSGYGFHIYLHSDHNTIKGCTAYDNSGFGIFLDVFSSYCTISDCSMYRTLSGIFLLYGSSYNTLENLTVYDNRWDGITIQYYSCDNRVSHCVSYNNDFGIFVQCGAERNMITDCNCYTNSYGIVFDIASNNNIIYHNNIFANAKNVFDSGINQWDNGAEGNYYDDYTGIDADGDGIGDSVYNIPGNDNQDLYPFMNPQGWDDPPYQPSNPSPMDGVLVEFTTSHFLILSWDGGDIDTGDSVTYKIFLSEEYPPKYHTTIGPFSSEETCIVFPCWGFGFGETYYWQIVARDDRGMTTVGPIWMFTIEK